MREEKSSKRPGDKLNENLGTYNIAEQLPNVETDRLYFKIIDMGDVDFIHQLYSDEGRIWGSASLRI